jgi:hypothetical protein
MSAKREGTFVVFRVSPDEKKLLKSLGQKPGEKDRYTVLCQLVGLAREMKFTRQKLRLPKPVRLRMPPGLSKTLKQISQQTSKPAVAVLIDLAREYRRRHPFP